MRNLLKKLKEKPRCVNGMVFLLILCLNIFLYWGSRDNYFFSDDFEWLARGVLAQNLPDAPAEITRIEGRDFNPFFMILLTLLIRFFGLSPLAFRLLSLLVFSAAIYTFFHILSRYFRVNPLISLSAALLCGFNVFVSETVLNMSALVYSLSLLLFLAGLEFFFAGKRILYFLFLLLAFLAKETIILAAIPLLFHETEKRNRRFIFASLGGLVLSRMLLQWLTAAPGTYTGFLSTSHFFYKLYFISMRALNISPYSMNPALGAGILVILALAAGYFVFSKKAGTGNERRGFLFFLLFFTVFALFFSLLPKLSSRYFFYPSFGLWGIAALCTHHFYEKNKKIKYALAPLLIISLLFNYPMITREGEDYKILGDFSRQFIRQQAAIIKNDSPAAEIIIYKPDSRPLAEVYQQIKNRENLPKLLPFRENGLGGVIAPTHLIPLVFYPGKIVRWYLGRETPVYFSGHLKITSGY